MRHAVVLDADQLPVGKCAGPVMVLPSAPPSHGKDVVVPVTCNDLPAQAIRAAVEVAARERGCVVVIECFQAPWSMTPSRRAVAAIEARQSETLDAQLATMHPPNVPVITEIVRDDLRTAVARIAPRAKVLVVDQIAAAGMARELVHDALTQHGMAVIVVPA